MPRLSFEVTVPRDDKRQRVVIAGTDPALGNWQPERGLELAREADGKFRGACDLPYGVVEFKITRGSWDMEETWPDGLPVLNYQYLIAHDLDVSISVLHWKDAPLVEAELLHGKAIETELDAAQLGHHRQVMVWLPPGYLRSNDSQHPVLYLLDGQDALSTLASPSNETLEADEWVRRLAAAGTIPDLVLVAVFHREDFGHRDVELSPQCDGPKMADFLVNDLKPFIDWILCRDRTLRDPAHTGLLGFGLGASLALWMTTRHSQTFGRFACLSPWFEDLSADKPDECYLVHELKSARGMQPSGMRLYVDHGTLGMDANAALYQKRLSAALGAKKFVEGRDYTVNVAHGAEHTLTAWRARLGAPLTFLFGK